MAATLSNVPLLGSTASGSNASVMSAWESARRKSRQLETQLYKKLQEFAQVQTALMNDAAQGRRSNRPAQQQQIDIELGRTGSSAAASSSAASAASASGSGCLAGLSPLLQYEALTGELEQLLSSFATTIDAMGKMLADAGGGGAGTGGGSANSLATEANQYLLSKNRTTLHENTLEFRRTKQNITAALARQELLSGAQARSDANATERGRTAQLLREGKSLQHSLDRTDDVIAYELTQNSADAARQACVDAAQSARDSLSDQGRVFTGVRGKLGQLGATFPVVGKLMGRINVSKQRDMIVLACVIATCMFLMFIYIMSKP